MRDRGAVVGLAAAAVAIPNAQVTVALMLRSVLVLALLTVVLPSSLGGLRPAVDAARLQPSVLLGALLGYVLDPLSWTGRAFVSQLMGQPGVVTALADAALWTALAWGGCTVKVRSHDRGRAPRTSEYLEG